MTNSFQQTIERVSQEVGKSFSDSASEQTKVAIETKMGNALSRWALEVMGRERTQYIHAGMQNFLALVALRVAETGCDEATAIKSVPFLIPLSLGKRALPFNQLRDIGLVISTKYYSLLPGINALKQTTRTGAQFRYSLAQLLPGARKEWLEKIERVTKASDIAAQYLVKQFKLSFQADALKKWLGTLNDIEKRRVWLEKRLINDSFTKEHRKSVKHFGLKNLS